MLKDTVDSATTLIEKIPHFGPKLSIGSQKIIEPVVAKKKDDYTFLQFLKDPLWKSAEAEAEAEIRFGHKIFHIPTFRLIEPLEVINVSMRY